MRLLGSIKLRTFLVCWVIYSLFFATNVVREPPEATTGYVGPYWWWEATSR